MEIDKTPVRIVSLYLDDLRLYFNRNLSHLEPWQIVLYTVSIFLFIQWIKKIFKNDEFVSLQKWWNDMLLNIPSYRKMLDVNKVAVLKEVEDHLLRFDHLKEFYKFLPDRGLSSEDILNEAISYKTMGGNEQKQFCGSLFVMLHEDSNFQKLLKNIFVLYNYTNASFPDSFPFCRKMEAEIIRMLCSLYHGSTNSSGTVTTSGTESIFLACLAYRNLASKNGIRKPEIIVGQNANIAFAKAAKILRMRVVYVGLTEKNKVNVGAIKRAISRETCLIVASAPSFVSGIMDNIEGISKLGLRYHVPVHVDATIGGFIIPFMEQCDYIAPSFDFRLSGVSSISVDLHKYAYCPTGVSAILYRDIALMHYQYYSKVNWPGGIYVSPTLASSRSGLLLALTWTTLLYNGRIGFVEKTQRILEAGCIIRKKLEEIEHINVLGDPLGPVMVFTSTNPQILIHSLGIELNKLGWTINFLQNPNALRLTIGLNQTHSDIIDSFIEDVIKSSDKVLEKFALDSNSEEKLIIKTNPIYGVSFVFEDRGLIDFLPRAFISAYYATPSLPSRLTRILNIEGRKLSQLKGLPDQQLLRKRLVLENSINNDSDLLELLEK